MNIAFFSESYKPYLSGVTNSIETLKHGLEDLGHKVIVFSPDYPKAEKHTDVYRFPSIPSPYPGYRLAIPVSMKYLEILKKNKIDIIHSHSPYQLGLLSMHYADKLKVPYIYTVHTMFGKYMHYFPLIPQRFTEDLMTSYIKWFCNRCAAVVAPTLKVKQDLITSGVKKRIEVIPTGIDLSLIKNDRAALRKRYGIPDDGILLLFVGRLAKEKNLEFLFEAFGKINAKRKNTHLLLAAGGPMEDEYSKSAGQNVIFAGQIGFPKVLSYYSAADIFVFSSLTETQGLVLAEAMAAGVPQVAVDAEGAHDVVADGKTGFLTKLSIEEFAAKVIKLIDDKELRRSMSERSKIAASSSFSKEAFAQKIELLYKSVL